MQPLKPKRATVRDYIAKRLFGYGKSGTDTYVDKFTGPAKDQGFLNAYQGMTYACVNAISEEVGKYTPYLYSLDNKGKKVVVPKHDFLTLLDHPNPDLSKYQLFEGAANFVEIFGEFFWYMVPGKLSGQPKEIYMLRPDKMGIAVDADTGDVLGYNYDLGAGKGIKFVPEEILHHMNFNPRNPYRGMGTIEAALDYIQTEEEVSRYTRNFFANNAGLSGVLNIKGKVAKDSWQKFVRQWRERYQGVENAGKVALVRDTSAEFTKVGLGLNEIDMQALKTMTMEQVMMMFRVPKGIFGMESEQGLGRASVETLEYIFAKRTIEPKLSRLDDTLQRAMDAYYPKDKLTVAHENQVPADKEFELKYYAESVDKWLTRQEIRDQEPDMATETVKGANDLFIPVNFVPVSESAAIGGGGASSGGSDTSSSSLVHVKKQAPEVVKISKKKVADSSVKGLADTTYEQKETFRKSIEQNAGRYAKLYRKAFVKVVEDQRQTVLGKLEHFGKDIAGSLMDPGSEKQSMIQKLTPVVTDIVETQGALAMDFAGSDGEFSLTNAIKVAITKSIGKMATSFNQDTLDQLQSTLSEGVAAGEGLDDLTTRVNEVYDGAETWRSERVARTESINASNDATREGYKQTGFVTAMTWFANPGACEFCDELDGKTVGLEDNFVNSGDSVSSGDHSYVADYGDVDNPPLHPNCSCTIVPVTEADS